MLSVISAISVIILHTNACFWAFSTKTYWFTANIIESIFYFAVPIFFMITGANLIDYQNKYTTKTYFKNRLVKTFIPFLVWSIIALIYKLIFNEINISSLSIISIYNGIVGTKYMDVYWFFIPLFCIYLCIPLLSAIDETKKKNLFIYLTISGFILNILLPFINSLLNYKLILNLNIPVVINYLFFVIAGYLLDKNDLNKKQRYIIYILGIIGLLTHIIGTYVLSMKSGTIVMTFKEYTNVPSVLYSIAVFVFFKTICKKKHKIIDFLSQYTFAMYLQHYFIIWLINKFFAPNIYSIFYRLGMPLIIVPVCILLTYLLRKIPILKRIVP